MKIAVASADGTTISQHFGHSAGFLVFEVEGTEVKSSEWRAASQSPHAAGVCQHEDDKTSSSQQSHGGFLDMIRDCEIVLCGGMGAGAAQALIAQGFQPRVLPVTGAAKDVVSLFLQGQISASASATCQCHH